MPASKPRRKPKEATRAAGGAGAKRKALPPGGEATVGNDDAGRRQSTKNAETGGSAPPPPQVDPRIVALRLVADWILRGENEVSIAEAIKTQFPDEDEKALFLSAFDYLGELAGTDPELRRTWHIAARRELYRRSLEMHDFKTARDILRDLAQIEGLYPKQAPTKSAKPAGAGAQADAAAAADGSEEYPVIQ